MHGFVYARRYVQCGDAPNEGGGDPRKSCDEGVPATMYEDKRVMPHNHAYTKLFQQLSR